MKLKINELAAIVYAELFGWPLTPSEARKWAIKTGRKDEKFYSWQPRAKLFAERKRREKTAEKKVAVAKRIAGVLAKIPTVEGIFLTGSVAVGNATKGSDVDLMIVTTPGALWLTRIAVILVLKWQGVYKKIICPNIFLDTDNLEIKEKNLYTAHEVLQAKCLFDRGKIEDLWHRKNEWAEKYLPNAVRKIFAVLDSQRRRWGPAARLKILLTAFLPLELVAFLAQYLYQLPKQTNERVGWGYAFFHPNQLGQKIEKKFWQRLIKYTSK